MNFLCKLHLFSTANLSFRNVVDETCKLVEETSLAILRKPGRRSRIVTDLLSQQKQMEKAALELRELQDSYIKKANTYRENEEKRKKRTTSK